MRILRPLLLALLAGVPSTAASQLTLLSRSTGLPDPTKEEGNTEFEFADLNGDGHLDIVSVGDHGSPFVNSGQHGIMVWLGDGAGNWTVSQTGNFGYGGVAAGDLDLDGNLDLAFGIHHDWAASGLGSRLMGAVLGDGSGTAWTQWDSGLATNGETWGMFATALGDFDGNGRLDVVSQSFGSGNGLRLYENHGNGTWSQAWALTGGNSGFTLEACDIDADGYLDILSTRSGAPVLLGDGAFGFTLATTGLPAAIRGIHNGDVLRDGRQEISFATGSEGVRCCRFDAATSTWISISTGLPTTGRYDLTQLGDVDGDGLLDLVCYRPRTGEVYLGDGAGTWTADATWTMPASGDTSALRIDGDIDHDGREDILISAAQNGFPFSRNQLRVYSAWTPPTTLSARVTFPRGGEVLRPGSLRNIRWLAAVPTAQGAATVDLELSRSGSAGPWTPIATGLPNSGSYQWSVSSLGGANCRVRVTVTTGTASASATSPADFRIPVTATCTFRNGSGVNPTGFECVTPPALGTDWDTTIPTNGNTLSTHLGIAAGPGRLAILGGELLLGLALPPVFLTGTGSHRVPLPNTGALLGAQLSSQGLRVDLVGGTPTLVLLNAQDLTLGPNS